MKAARLIESEARWIRALLILATLTVALVFAGLASNVILYFSDIILILVMAWLFAFVLSPVVSGIKLVGVSSGVAYGALGPTHHSIEDEAGTRVIDNLPVSVPGDPVGTRWAIQVAYQQPGPFFIRTSRMPVPIVHAADQHFEVGRAVRLREGGDITLIANGVMVHMALQAAADLAGDGIEARVLDMATASPIDRAAVVAAARETRGIVTAEEHIVRGGLGGAVAEIVVTEQPVPMRILGFPGFAPTGPTEFLLEHAGLVFGVDADAFVLHGKPQVALVCADLHHD